MMTTMAEKTIVDLRRVFSTRNLSVQLVSDNRAQFTSEQLLRESGIKHVLSAPYHPFTNGEAEKIKGSYKQLKIGIKTAKKTLDHLRLNWLDSYLFVAALQ